MKFLPTELYGRLLGGVLLGGVLMVLPSTARNAFAQSTQSGASARTQTAPSAPSATAPANRGISSLDPNAPPPPAHPITMAQTRELLDLMGYKKIEESNWSQMIAMNKRAAPFIPDDVWSDVQTNISGIDYPTLMQPIYAKYLSQEDAAKALDFYRTPAGKRVLQSMPPMLGESVAAAQQKGRQVGRDAIEKHRPEIEEAQKKYQAEHAPPAGSTTPGGATPAQPGSPSTPPTPPPPSTTKPQR
ncbi:MAG TPA: DUF2059 domain-containing protein [Acidobacteriaceae bacterium]|jgi:hypothetical protein